MNAAEFQSAVAIDVTYLTVTARGGLYYVDASGPDPLHVATRKGWYLDFTMGMTAARLAAVVREIAAHCEANKAWYVDHPTSIGYRWAR